MKIDELRRTCGRQGAERTRCDKVAEIAELCGLGQHEKAIEYQGEAAGKFTKRVSIEPAGRVLRPNRQRQSRRDLPQAGRISPWSGTWFNLSLALKAWETARSEEAVDAPSPSTVKPLRGASGPARGLGWRQS